MKRYNNFLNEDVEGNIYNVDVTAEVNKLQKDAKEMLKTIFLIDLKELCSKLYLKITIDDEKDVYDIESTYMVEKRKRRLSFYIDVVDDSNFSIEGVDTIKCKDDILKDIVDEVFLFSDEKYKLPDKISINILEDIGLYHKIKEIYDKGAWAGEKFEDHISNKIKTQYEHIFKNDLF